MWHNYCNNSWDDKNNVIKYKVVVTDHVFNINIKQHTNRRSDTKVTATSIRDAATDDDNKSFVDYRDSNNIGNIDDAHDGRDQSVT